VGLQQNLEDIFVKMGSFSIFRDDCQKKEPYTSKYLMRFGVFSMFWGSKYLLRRHDWMSRDRERKRNGGETQHPEM